MTDPAPAQAALSVGSLMRDLHEGLVARKREVLTVVTMCYGPAALCDLGVTPELTCQHRKEAPRERVLESAVVS